MRLELFVEDFLQQGGERRQAFQFVQQVTGATLLRACNRGLLIVEYISLDGLAGDGDTAFFHQLLALRNAEKRQQVILFSGVVEPRLQGQRQRFVIAVFLQPIVGGIEKNTVVIRPGTEDETAGQSNGRLFVGVEQNSLGAHWRGLRVAQFVARQLYVREPGEIFAVETVSCRQRTMQTGEIQNVGEQEWCGRTGHHQSSDRGALGPGLNSRGAARSTCGR
ncbi:hypothetical protein [Pseudomonas sp. 14A]|uniref:hypothetical protein n=1 Tax=Pseudomonas sp. 14A TaxID=2823142 RepID=UPI0020133621|nr:hypothetical protein [Pseudomonas sp. 14A]